MTLIKPFNTGVMVMIDEWCRGIIIKFNGTGLVVVCKNGTPPSDSKHDPAIMYDPLRDWRGKKCFGLG
jgi:hypothetical protein